MCQDLGISNTLKEFMDQVLIVPIKPMSFDTPCQSMTFQRGNSDIGDTKFDLIGGQTVGIKTMAVTWGFGDLEELLLYSPDFICHSPLDILETLKK